MRKHKDSSSLVKYLAQNNHWPESAQGEIPTPKRLWAKLMFNVVYQRNPIIAVHSFGTNRCKVCMREQVEILRRSFDPTVKLMNSQSEIHSTYLHKPYFHRFSADEAIEANKVTNEDITLTPNVCFALINHRIQRHISDPNYFIGVCCQSVTARNSQTVDNIPTMILV
eukprot:13060076-Ditylum_brightwellii.AAC.1